MHTLIYTSRAASDISQVSLMDILTKSRANNHSIQVTGMLLYYKQSFMQVLEGAKDVIFDLLDNRIVSDCRHTGVSLSIDYAIDTRLFPDWTMGFLNLDTRAPVKIEGFTDFFTEGFSPAVVLGDRSMAQSLLLSLKTDYEKDLS
ncbi:BLUF domain-containing protein [Exilibacterium tricleocarpae]|uniref:BLUF domain-containing protein n=1 Tax=Exilibacterium tricleocarpae TaxID=2591008 RepID=A0A545T876_9GAMM|nr:BLUF domain-containing protein [Exilibacterium tricleocarpae]TQV73388.1 BLUF domain-containing protein [Exilibacterium tricleocarpae]